MPDVLTIGTGAQCELRITDDEYVSTRHAQIWTSGDGRTFVDDLGSMNGTWIIVGHRGMAGAEIRVRRPELLYPGDVIRVGRTRVARMGENGALHLL